jgi:hypothetical protein
MKKRNASHSFALFIVGFRRSRRRRAVYIPKMFMFVVVSLRVFNPFLFKFFFPLLFSSLLTTTTTTAQQEEEEKKNVNSNR